MKNLLDYDLLKDHKKIIFVNLVPLNKKYA